MVIINATKIRALLAEKQMSLLDVYHKSGIAPNTVYNIFKRKALMPTLYTVNALAKCFDVKALDLLKEVDDN